MNRELVSKLMDHLDAHPEDFDMSDHFRKIYYPGAVDGIVCQTIGCLAGLTTLLAGVDDDTYTRHGTPGVATRLIAGDSASQDLQREVGNLFYTDSWPTDLKDRYRAIEAAVPTGARFNQIHNKELLSEYRRFQFETSKLAVELLGRFLAAH